MDNHNFTFSELHPNSKQNIQPFLRLLIFFKKHPDITEEHFRQWWGSVHADLTLSGYGVNVHMLRYVQFRQTADHKKQLRGIGMEVLDFDGMGEIHVRSLKDWVKFSSQPIFDEKLSKDGQNFMSGPIHVMLGQDNLIYGSKIVTSGGEDGLLPGDKRLKPESKL